MERVTAHWLPRPARRAWLRGCARTFAVALVTLSVSACAETTLSQAAGPVASVQATDPQTAEYQAKLAAYEQAHGAYEAESKAYWNAVSAKRKQRNAKRRNKQRIVATDYVLTQPPVYDGPPKPKNPFEPEVPPQEQEKKQIPVVADFLEAAREQYAFVPDRPRSEFEFKRAYAAAALEAGLDKEQVVGIYAFETGGHGAHDTQAGLLFDKPGARAISPALGYNQLLSALTVSLLSEYGKSVIEHLQEKERRLSGEARQRMARKIAAVRRMVAVARSVPHRWSAYNRFARHTAKGRGMHAVLLDVDIGPLLQVQNLANSLRFARIKGYQGRMSAAELELMNLTGAGNGFDMVMMPHSLREKVPTSNFFVPSGYWRNPIAHRTKVVAELVAEIQRHIDRAAKNPGAQELAAAF